MEGFNFPKQDWMKSIATSRDAKTLVLFGKVGNGKSALGNSIFGKKQFESKISPSGVTTTCKLETTVLDDGQVVNVIDTPGLFDSSRGSGAAEYLAHEMVKCIYLAEDGFDGLILVCSIKTRFSTEEEGVFKTLKDIFGEKIFNYMIIVFTGGDELDMTFPEYLSKCPRSLERSLQLCKHRIVLFDNKTKDETQRRIQLQELMSYIAVIRAQNGQPYAGDVFEMMKKEAYFKRVNQDRIKYEVQQKQLEYVKGYEAPISMIYGAQASGSEMVLVRKNDEAKLRKQVDKARQLYQQEKLKNEKIEKENEMLKRDQIKKSQSVQDIRGGEIKISFIVRVLGNCTIM